MDADTPQTVAQAIEAAAQRQQHQSTPQTVAQAIEAATLQQEQQQQQHASDHPSPSATNSHMSSSGIDNLACQWQGCGERCDNAESLYDHVCERHVGRKSTNNLNLTCAWGACRTTTVKRDHITSHIRVHVPLKPHKCDFCGKAFKRPQDLKKHVKTHADDSVLMNSPQPPHPARSNGSNGHTSKNDASSLNIAEAIQAYMANPRGNLLYSGNDNSLGNQYTSYQTGMTTGPDNGYSHQNAQYSNYGSVSYPANPAMADVQSMDTRRRAIEALNDFLGDIKRRALNPNKYYDVGRRLQPNALPLPIATGNGYNMGYTSGHPTDVSNAAYTNNYSNSSLLDIFGQNTAVTGATNGGLQGHVAQAEYALPVPNARTKGDLQDIDRFLEQLQATVYESSSVAAAAGVQQPLVHAQFTNDFGFGGANHQTHRSSQSPPTQQLNNGLGMNSSNLAVSQASLDTPALTPASVSSYSSSGQSPLSSAGRPSIGSNNGMYPTLPSVTGISDMGSGYPTTTSAPASGLATSYDDIDGRRYSGGRLQRQKPQKESAEVTEDVEMADEPEGTKTPRQEDITPEAKSDKDVEITDRSEEHPEAESEDNTTTNAASPSESDQEEWVENIRVIEAIRKWIDARLKNHEYDEESENSNGDEMNVDDESASDKDHESDAKAVETAKAVEEKMAEALSHANAQHDEQVKKEAAGEVEYPSLPTA